MENSQSQPDKSQRPDTFNNLSVDGEINIISKDSSAFSPELKNASCSIIERSTAEIKNSECLHEEGGVRTTKQRGGMIDNLHGTQLGIPATRIGQQTAYQHHLPRKSANKVITEGILLSRQQARRQPPYAQAAGKQTTASIAGSSSEENKHSVAHGGVNGAIVVAQSTSLQPHNSLVLGVTSEQETVASQKQKEQKVMTIHVKNKVLMDKARLSQNININMNNSGLHHGLATTSAIQQQNLRQQHSPRDITELVITTSSSPRRITDTIGDSQKKQQYQVMTSQPALLNLDLVPQLLASSQQSKQNQKHHAVEPPSPEKYIESPTMIQSIKNRGNLQRALIQNRPNNNQANKGANSIPMSSGPIQVSKHITLPKMVLMSKDASTTDEHVRSVIQTQLGNHADLYIGQKTNSSTLTTNNIHQQHPQQNTQNSNNATRLSNKENTTRSTYIKGKCNFEDMLIVSSKSPKQALPCDNNAANLDIQRQLSCSKNSDSTAGAGGAYSPKSPTRNRNHHQQNYYNSSVTKNQEFQMKIQEKQQNLDSGQKSNRKQQNGQQILLNSPARATVGGQKLNPRASITQTTDDGDALSSELVVTHLKPSSCQQDWQNPFNVFSFNSAAQQQQTRFGAAQQPRNNQSLVDGGDHLFSEATSNFAKTQQVRKSALGRINDPRSCQDKNNEDGGEIRENLASNLLTRNLVLDQQQQQNSQNNCTNQQDELLRLLTPSNSNNQNKNNDDISNHLVNTVGGGTAVSANSKTGGRPLIDQIMKPPRLTNYQQLKRPKTNRLDASAAKRNTIIATKDNDDYDGVAVEAENVPNKDDVQQTAHHQIVSNEAIQQHQQKLYLQERGSRAAMRAINRSMAARISKEEQSVDDQSLLIQQIAAASAGRTQLHSHHDEQLQQKQQQFYKYQNLSKEKNAAMKNFTNERHQKFNTSAITRNSLEQQQNLKSDARKTFPEKQRGVYRHMRLDSVDQCTAGINNLQLNLLNSSSGGTAQAENIVRFGEFALHNQQHKTNTTNKTTTAASLTAHDETAYNYQNNHKIHQKVVCFQRNSLQAHLSSALQQKIHNEFRNKQQQTWNTTHTNQTKKYHHHHLESRSVDSNKDQDHHNQHKNLVVSGNRATISKDLNRYSPLMNYDQASNQQHPTNFDYLQQRLPYATSNSYAFNVIDQQLSQQSPDRRMLLQLSNDSSRSPIPIDPELLKQMNMCLPSNIDGSDAGKASNSDLLSKNGIGSFRNSHVINNQKEASPGRKSSKHSNSEKVIEINADMVQFTQVRQFIMSPKNMQKTLRNQQKAIRADMQKQRQKRESLVVDTQQPGASILRTAATQQNDLRTTTGSNNSQELDKKGLNSRSKPRNAARLNDGLQTKPQQVPAMANSSIQELTSVQTSLNIIQRAGSSSGVIDTVNHSASSQNEANCSQESKRQQNIRVTDSQQIKALQKSDRKMKVETLLSNHEETCSQKRVKEKSKNQELLDKKKAKDTMPSHEVAVLVNNMNIEINNRSNYQEDSNMIQDVNQTKNIVIGGASSAHTNYRKQQLQSTTSRDEAVRTPRQLFEPVLNGKRNYQKTVSSPPQSPSNQEQDDQTRHLETQHLDQEQQEANIEPSIDAINVLRRTSEGFAAVAAANKTTSSVNASTNAQKAEVVLVDDAQQQTLNQMAKHQRQQQQDGCEITNFKLLQNKGIDLQLAAVGNNNNNCEVGDTTGRNTTEQSSTIGVEQERTTNQVIVIKKNEISSNGAADDHQNNTNNQVERTLQYQNENNSTPDDQSQLKMMMLLDQNSQQMYQKSKATSVMTKDIYDINSRSNLDSLMQPSYEHAALENNQSMALKNATLTSDDEHSSDEVTTEMALGKLKLDAKTMSKCNSKENGALDFVNLKVQEYLRIQRQLPSLDYNTLQSEKDQSLNTKTQFVFKSIALQPLSLKQTMMSKAKGNSPNSNINHASPLRHKIHFDLNQQRNMKIKNEIQTKMFRFKNKSEQTRYTRIAKCIMSLVEKGQNHNAQQASDIEFIYMKIFRFLADLLSQHEFDCLSYYHVSRFISIMIHLNGPQQDDGQYSQLLNSNQEGRPMSLRQFVCNALDFRYEKTTKSKAIINMETNNIQHQNALVVKPLWNNSMTSATSPVDIYRNFKKYNAHNSKKQKMLQKGNAEVRLAIISEKIAASSHKTQALEPALPAVVRTSFFRDKETIKRGNLARLQQSTKKNQNNLDIKGLEQQSNIARNKIMLEHVVASRNMHEWRNQILEELHKEQRNTRSVGNSRKPQQKIDLKILAANKKEMVRSSMDHNH